MLLLIDGSLAWVVTSSLTQRSTGAQLYDGFVVQFSVPHPISFTLNNIGQNNTIYLVLPKNE